MTVEVFIWLCAFVSFLSLVSAQLIYWYDMNQFKLRLDNHLRREGQPVPERKGFWWWLFLKLAGRFS